MVNTAQHILSFIPQREPFVMVDQLLHSDETVTRSSFVVRRDNIFVEYDFFKEPGLVENIAQTAAARAGHFSQLQNKPVALGYIGAIKNLQVYFLPKTGDQLLTEITVQNQIFDVTLIAGKITCNQKEVATCEMKIFINQIKNS
jgi:3-hydroxymyristoyl/3-hydroxydecanoyl-(acyl carrier protein) dehydratase